MGDTESVLTPTGYSTNHLPSLNLSSTASTTTARNTRIASIGSPTDLGSPPAYHSMPTQIVSIDDTPELFEPLYPGADISVCAALCAIMQFCSSNKLSYTAIGELLKLLLLLCPFPNKLPTSFYKFKKFFQQFHMPYDHSTVCSVCQKSDENCHCLHTTTSAHLLHIPIDKPLQTIVSSK